jgi:hypothetical protein
MPHNVTVGVVRHKLEAGPVTSYQATNAFGATFDGNRPALFSRMEVDRIAQHMTFERLAEMPLSARGRFNAKVLNFLKVASIVGQKRKIVDQRSRCNE